MLTGRPIFGAVVWLGLSTVLSGYGACTTIKSDGLGEPARRDWVALQVFSTVLGELAPSCAPAAVAVSAQLLIAGHQPCPLAVHPDSGDAEGFCDSITIGIIRPLLLVYTVGDLVVAVARGQVDLSTDALPPFVETISLEFDQGAAMSTPEDLIALDMLAEAEDNAARWQQFSLHDAGTWSEVTFDTDNDGITDLEEACAGTL